MTTTAATAPAVVYSAPLIITAGGTYSGNWATSDANVPAVDVRTTEPVLIQNCNLKGPGNLVNVRSQGASVTVRNCKGLGTVPTVAGQYQGRFFYAAQAKNVIIERNTFENTGGIMIAGDGQAAETINVRFNRSRNINGRAADGVGGYSSTISRLDCFVWVGEIPSLQNLEISWNEVVNEPGKSRVEDVINIHRVSGTQQQPIRVHDNYINGAYPANPLSTSFSGGGILVEGSAATLAAVSAYVVVSNNQVINTTNYGIAIAAGHDNLITRNRVVGSNMLSPLSRSPAANVGIYVWDHYINKPNGTFFANTANNNVIGWLNKYGQRNDAYIPDCAAGTCTGNTSAAATITTTTDAAEYPLWTAKLQLYGVTVGSSI